MNTKLIIFGLLGGGLLIYLISKLQPAETQVVSQVVPVGTIPNNAGTDSKIAFEANKTQAFTSLLGLAQSQNELTAATKNLDTAVTLESIKGNSAIELNKTNNETERKLGEFGYYATLKGFDRDINLADIRSKSELESNKLKSETELSLQRDYLQSVLEQLNLENKFKSEQAALQVNTLNQVAQTYRNQSLERQGTILNAFTTTFNGQAPYNYQSAFGGTRPPTFLQQLTGFADSIGLGGLLGKWF